MAADAGVDDVHIIAALALHRRMHEFELRHALGDRVYDAFEPRGLLYQHDAEDPDSSPSSVRRPRARRSRSTSGPPSPTCSSTSTSTSSPWTAGGSRRPSASRRTARSATITTRTTMEASHSFMDQHRSELHKSSWRMGKVMRDHGPKIFQIETTLNTDTFPKPFGFLSKREWEWNAKDRATLPRRREVVGQGTAAAGPQDLPRHRGAAPDDERPVRRGRSGPQGHHGERLPPAARRGRRARPTSSRWASRTSARTTCTRS